MSNAFNTSCWRHKRHKQLKIRVVKRGNCILECWLWLYPSFEGYFRSTTIRKYMLSVDKYTVHVPTLWITREYCNVGHKFSVTVRDLFTLIAITGALDFSNNKTAHSRQTIEHLHMNNAWFKYIIFVCCIATWCQYRCTLLHRNRKIYIAFRLYQLVVTTNPKPSLRNKIQAMVTVVCTHHLITLYISWCYA